MPRKRINFSIAFAVIIVELSFLVVFRSKAPPLSVGKEGLLAYLREVLFEPRAKPSLALGKRKVALLERNATNC